MLGGVVGEIVGGVVGVIVGGVVGVIVDGVLGDPYTYIIKSAKKKLCF